MYLFIEIERWIHLFTILKTTMKPIKAKTHFIFLLLLSIISCSEDETIATDNSRVLQYEVTGNFTGEVFASYTGATGNIINEQLTNIPWTKEIIYSNNVTAVVIAISGNGGVANQEVTLIIKKGGVQISNPIIFKANVAGSFTGSSPGIVL